MKFTVVSLQSVEDALTNLWLTAPDAKAVTEASDWIEHQLRYDPLTKVSAVDNLYYIRRDPLVALCDIDVVARTVEIVEIHRVASNS